MVTACTSWELNMENIIALLNSSKVATPIVHVMRTHYAYHQHGEMALHQTSPLTLTMCKDTVIVPAGGLIVVIRFVSDNPGYWFMHCHIKVHQIQADFW